MNFEPASERMAHDRYTSEAFATLANGFVCLIASPDRHTPNDYDEHGQRVPCPRFGCVTCGEHIAVEPRLFEKYFKNNRVAPRHMGVTVDGKELFDIFLTNDLDRINAAMQEHGKASNGAASPYDSSAREQEEAAYMAADRAKRASLLEAAGRAKYYPYDLIRLGLYDDAPELRAAARQALVRTATPAAQSFILQALDDEADPAARKVLLPALIKVADDKPPTLLALRVHEAMLRDPDVPQREAWLKALRASAPEPVAEPDDDIDARIEELSGQAARKDAKAATFVDLATATLRFARMRMADGRDAQFLLEESRQAVDKALAKDGKNVAAHALRAELAQLMGDREIAATHARIALPALLASGKAATQQAGAALIGLAEGASRAIYDSEAKKAAWDGKLLAEAAAAYDVLAAHPVGTAAHAGAHADLMSFLGLRGCARMAIESALRRFPAEASLHERFRTMITQASGVDALTAAYERLGETAVDRASHAWFSAFAEFVIAEHNKRQGDNEKALAAYARSVDGFLSSQRENPAYAESASWYAAMGRVGQARVSLDMGSVQDAAALVAEGIKRLPAIAEREDGLGRTPLFTLKQILAKLTGDDHSEARATLERELATTVPDVWAKAVGQ